MKKLKLLGIFVLLFFVVFSSFTQSITYLTEQGDELYISEKYFDALYYYKEALKLNSNFYPALLGISRSYFFLQEFDEALYWVEKVYHFDKTSPEVLSLYGRILIGVNRKDEALAIFNSILAKYPNNVEATLGLAEIEILNGHISKAISLFEKGLSLSPENKRALLSLVILLDRQGKSKSETYIEKALKLFSNEYQVQLIAARHYYNQKNFTKAQFHGGTALSLAPESIEAYDLYASSLFQLGYYEMAITNINEMLKLDPHNKNGWTVLALIYLEQGRYKQAVQAFERIALYYPDDEIFRIALEEILILYFKEEDTFREKYSLYHSEMGDQYQNGYRFSMAMHEYKRSLKIYPYSKNNRLKLANLYKRIGYYEKYLKELMVLQDLGLADQSISDEIEIQQSLQNYNLAQKWSFNPFLNPREAYTFSLFTLLENDIYRDQTNLLVSSFSHDLLNKSENISVFAPLQVGGYSQAFERARKNNSDYFIIENAFYDSDKRSFELRYEIYLTRTGSLIAEKVHHTTGNRRITDAVTKMKNFIFQSLPVRGILVKKSFKEGLINLGFIDGIEKDSKMIIIKKNAIALDTRTFGLLYSEDDIVGEYTVKEINEFVSTGSIREKSILDSVNVGDTVLIYLEPEETDPELSTTEQQVLYNQTLKNEVLKIK